MMLDLLPTLLPILLVDVVNPVLFAVMVFAAGSSRPVGNSSAILIGHTLAYFVGGIVVSVGIDQIIERLANPQRIDFIISGIVGIVLIWFAIPMKKKGAPRANEPEWELTPIKCLGFGAMVNFVGIPFAVPYFAVIGQILKANLSAPEALTVLAIYNLGYALPFMVVPILVAALGEKAKPLLEKINGFLVRGADIVMPWMFGLLGLALISDSIAYFYRGEGLWQF